MKTFTITCKKCGSTDVQPFYQDHGQVDNHDVGLNCRDCGNNTTLKDLEKEWLDDIDQGFLGAGLDLDGNIKGENNGSR